jgi:transcription elongation factor Elf1
MADEIIKESDEIQETDIVFDCPHCGKSLCIDYRGAGLNITCTDCGRDTAVPIPEGMELDDLDSTPQDQEVRIINLRNSLAQSEARAHALAEEVELLKTRCTELKAARDAVMQNASEVRERIAQIEQSQEDIYRAVDGLAVLVGVRSEEPSGQ